jgi:DNA invertase Pin-like site-specific DNA recombinase
MNSIFCKKRYYILEKIYVDKMTGKNFNRPRYTVLKEDVLREGDTLIIFELDRLGRSKSDIAMDLQYFKNKGNNGIIISPGLITSAGVFCIIPCRRHSLPG